MNKYHVILISTKGYHWLAAYPTMQQAAERAITQGVKSMGCVVRDGNTGKRYCIAELNQITF